MRTVALVLLGLLGCGDDVSGNGGSSGAGGRAGSGGAGGIGGGGAGGGIGGAGGIGGGGGTGGTGGAGATICPPLAAPSGTIVRVAPAQANDLPAMVASASAGTTLLLDDGTYRMTTSGEAARRIHFAVPGVTLRSASGNAAAVVLDGEYLTDEMMFVDASDVTIAEVTLMRVVHHLVHVTAPDGGPDVSGVRLLGLRLVDAGQQFVKVNENAARTFWVDGGRVECSFFLLTDAGRPHVDMTSTPCYTGGIDTHSGRGWVVRRNRFETIYCPSGLAEHAIHFWTGSRDTLVEQNTIVNCGRGVGFGLGVSDAGRSYPDNPYPGVGYVGHYDGIIRNNMIDADQPGFDTGIELDQARGVRVYHNTVYSTDAVVSFFSSIDYRFPNTVADIRNNLVRVITMRDGATGTVDHNLMNVPAGYFVSPPAV